MTHRGRSIGAEAEAWREEAGIMAAPAQGEVRELPTSLVQAEQFRRLAEGRLDGAYRLARAILHSAPDAEDATHDAFVLAWRSWRTLRDPARFDAWFDRILVNVCRNRLRWAGRHRHADLTPELVGNSPDPYRAVGERDAVARAMRALSPEQRIVVVLRFYSDLSVEETAARMGIPAGTVKSRLHHAVRRLGTAMSEAEMEELST
jgi:RNA polymerase sigma-70 factor (ECF subfamily)